MSQALHIFKKDVRYLRFEIAIALFFVAAFSTAEVRRTLSEGYLDPITHFILPWTLPLAMLAWANLHGGFAMGFLALGVYLTAACCGLAIL